MSTKGYKYPNRKKAIPHSKESRIRQIQTHKLRQKLGLLNHRSWNKGTKGLSNCVCSEIKKETIRKKLIGHKISDETREKLFARPKRFGEKNPNWKNGSSKFPYALEWTPELRRSIRERDNYTCQLCGKPQTDFSFDVHHIDYNKLNCDPKNLITLCKHCHRITNSKRDYWTNYFQTL